MSATALTYFASRVFDRSSHNITWIATVWSTAAAIRSFINKTSRDEVCPILLCLMHQISLILCVRYVICVCLGNFCGDCDFFPYSSFNSSRHEHTYCDPHCRRVLPGNEVPTSGKPIDITLKAFYSCHYHRFTIVSLLLH